jgi:hypothetical protein
MIRHQIIVARDRERRNPKGKLIGRKLSERSWAVSTERLTARAGHSAVAGCHDAASYPEGLHAQRRRRPDRGNVGAKAHVGDIADQATAPLATTAVIVATRRLRIARDGAATAA